MNLRRMPRKRSLHAAISIVMLCFGGVAGCTLEPAYQRPPAMVAQSYPRPDAGATSAGPLAAELGWRDVFVDARLQHLIDLALHNNQDLRVAILNVEEAQAQYRIERAALFPTLTGNAVSTRERTPADLSFSGQPATGSDDEVDIGASWEIDLFGRVRSLSHEALHRYLATSYARKAAQIALVSQVADQYFTLHAYDEQLAVTRNALDTAQASYGLAEQLSSIGTASALDLAESETALDTAKANLASQMRLRAQAVDALVLLVGQPLPPELTTPLPLGDSGIVSEISAGMPSDLLTRRPDILEAEETLRAANANVGAARAAFFPSITLTGQAGTASTSLAGLFMPGSAAWSYGPQISLPIFEGGANVAGLKVAHVETAIAVAQYQKAIQTAFREVADGLAAQGTYDTELAALEQDQAAEQRRLDLSQARYRDGIDSYLTVLTAQDSLYSAQINVVSTRLARLTNLVDLYGDLGGGWIEHNGDIPPFEAAK